MKLPKHRKRCCSCLALLEVQAHPLRNFKHKYRRLPTLTFMQRTCSKTEIFFKNIDDSLWDDFSFHASLLLQDRNYEGPAMMMIGKEELRGL